MFHVDALSDTNGMLHTGDDVIVTYEGALAIGTIPPAGSTTKVIVTDGGTPTSPKSPLRIVDGNQSEGRVMTSDADGRGTWAELSAGFSLGESYGRYGVAGMSIKVGDNAGDNDSHFTDLGIAFTANAAGYYAFEVRWWARTQSTSAAGSDLYQHFRLKKNSAVADQFEAYTNTIGGAEDICTISFTFYSNAVPGDVLRLQARAFIALVTDNNPSTLWTRTLVNIVRMH
jgi:hypothetical protein